MALRRPDCGWHSPFVVMAREASVMPPRLDGAQEKVKRCHARPDARSSAAGFQSSSMLISTLSIPPSAQAQPQISVGLPAAMLVSGAGATITDCGAMAQTGVVWPAAVPASSYTGSLYQRVVNGPGARSCASVMRVSHFTLLVP